MLLVHFRFNVQIRSIRIEGYRLTMCIEIALYGFEITAILSWYKYVQGNTVHFGGYPLLPLEQALVCKLKYHEDVSVSFTETELEIMCSWMNRVVCSKYGSEEQLFGYERRAYIKLKEKLKVREVVLSQ